MKLKLKKLLLFKSGHIAASVPYFILHQHVDKNFIKNLLLMISLFILLGRNLSAHTQTTFSTRQWRRCLSASMQAFTRCAVERFLSCFSLMNCKPWSSATPTMTGRSSKRSCFNLNNSCSLYNIVKICPLLPVKKTFELFF